MSTEIFEQCTTTDVSGHIFRRPSRDWILVRNLLVIPYVQFENNLFPCYSGLRPSDVFTEIKHLIIHYQSHAERERKVANYSPCIFLRT